MIRQFGQCSASSRECFVIVWIGENQEILSQLVVRFPPQGQLCKIKSNPFLDEIFLLVVEVVHSHCYEQLLVKEINSWLLILISRGFQVLFRAAIEDVPFVFGEGANFLLILYVWLIPTTDDVSQFILCQTASRGSYQCKKGLHQVLSVVCFESEQNLLE